MAAIPADHMAPISGFVGLICRVTFLPTALVQVVVKPLKMARLIVPRAIELQHCCGQVLGREIVYFDEMG